MSGVSRRGVLGAAALVGAAGAIGLQRFGRAALEADVVVYDSRKPVSLAFVQARWGAIRSIDLAAERARNWRSIRGLARGDAVAGLTSWNDYVFARQWLEERGLRIVEESHDEPAGLTRWLMA